jgi:hypothetical protein
VVPRLLGDGHLNGVKPVIVHGDLWSGNASKGIIGGQGDVQDVIYDSSACYAHSEYELGIMNMFGGFGGSFLKEYHAIIPKTEPVQEYEDRVALYELYHHLNHHVGTPDRHSYAFYDLANHGRPCLVVVTDLVQRTSCQSFCGSMVLLNCLTRVFIWLGPQAGLSITLMLSFWDVLWRF